MSKKVIGIVGFGRFGRVLHDLFEDGFDIVVSSSTYRQGDIDGVRFAPLKEVVERANAVFLAGPIGKVGEIAEKIRPFLRPGQVVVDVCSVKEHPFGILKKTLGSTGAHIWPTHPVFGPDSSQQGFEGLRWISCEEEIDTSIIKPYLDYLEQKGLTIVKISCEEHDRLAARTQGLTHLIGRVLEVFGADRTIIDTTGFERLINVKEQTCNDTWELYCDLQYYNRYTLENETRLREAMDKVFSRFLDSTTSREHAVLGVYGWEGSAVDEAAGLMLDNDAIDSFGLLGNKHILVRSYDTADSALLALNRGEIDLCMLAACDAAGPLAPTLEAMGEHSFEMIHVLERNDLSFVLVRRRR